MARGRRDTDVRCREPTLLVEVTRGDRVESRHPWLARGAGPDGSARVALDDVAEPVYARSALKPLRATVVRMIETLCEQPIAETSVDSCGAPARRGVWADGRAFAVTIADGAGRAAPVVVAAVPTSWGCTGPAVRRWSAVPVLGGGAAVGEVRAPAGLLVQP